MRQNRTCALGFVPASTPPSPPPKPLTMTNGVLIDPLDGDPRPPKRPRQVRDIDVGMRPYTIPVPGPSGVHSETDGNAEGAPKKGRKRPLSCGECRRLKLKCDRVFPCQSCCKRGCAEICPDGALTGGKGSRFILANTEQLHEKIKCMSERIRQLEEALQALQSQLSPNKHPLLQQELLSIKKSPELFGVDHPTTSYGASGIDRLRRDDDFPHSERHESGPSSRDGFDDSYAAPQGGSSDFPQCNQLEDFARLSRGFPTPWSVSYQLNPDVRQRIREMLPPVQEATYLCEQARVNAFWQFNPDNSQTFLPNLIHSVYNAQISSLLPHRLGLFLMILAIGCRVDPKQISDSQEAEKYYCLSRVALCEVPVMDETSFDAVNALFYMVWYLLMFSEQKRAVEFAWGLTGLMLKLATSLGLHRDGNRSKVIPEELDKRRILFWDIVNIEARLSLMLRRPPALSVRYFDARSPTFSSDDGPGAFTSASYHEWQHNFLVHCMLPVADAVAVIQAPEYTEILGLDGRIRDFDVPNALRMMDQDDMVPPHPRALQQALIACNREIALLQLHRSYFTYALNASDGFTFKHKYAPSVLATFTSSCNLIWTIYTLYRWEPDASVRFSTFWGNCFSAAVALCFFISKVPSCPLVTHGLQELDRVLRLFTEARDRCPSAAKFLPAVEILNTKCHASYVRWRSGLALEEDPNDEICVLARKTGILQCNTSSLHPIMDGAGSNPFEHAHPSLARCLEHATVEPPCSDDALERVRTSVQSCDVSWGSTAPSLRNVTGFGQDIHESTWMSWF
ncbi:unnamed protein product [Somion occarium]|uniref:Zn(2)-C6 fungal-type domain-containing protein n=1 Tax=Somion occarium TaxID=3059160 RepID=A0ABP1E193_9APHY